MQIFLFFEHLPENLTILSEIITKHSAAVLHDKPRMLYGVDGFEKATFAVEIFEDLPNLSRAEYNGCFASCSEFYLRFDRPDKEWFDVAEKSGVIIEVKVPAVLDKP